MFFISKMSWPNLAMPFWPHLHASCHFWGLNVLFFYYYVLSLLSVYYSGELFTVYLPKVFHLNFSYFFTTLAVWYNTIFHSYVDIYFFFFLVYPVLGYFQSIPEVSDIFISSYLPYRHITTCKNQELQLLIHEWQ